MSLYDLLPPNATQLERDFSRVTSSLERASRPVPTIRTAKRVNIPDSIVPWLIYEYGLQELLPYLKDPRRAIEEGVLWQRIRGTKAALEQALDWIEYPATIEESESQTLRWAEFQLALDAHPDSFDAIDDVVAVSKLSAPARSRNFRIYNGYDERRFRLDHHVLGEGLLCDHSGVIVREDWPQLSFGRYKFRNKSFTEDFVSETVENKILAFEGIYEDKFILSHSHIDEWWHLLDTGISTGARLHFRVYDPLEIDCQIYPPLKYAWTGLYLSDDGWYLEDTHAAFSHRVEVETGSVMRLSEADPQTKDGSLSEQVFRTEFRELTKRLERDHFAEVAVGEGRGGFLAQHIRRHGVEAIYEDRFLLDAGLVDEQWHLIDLLSRDVQHTYQSRYDGLLDGATWDPGFNWEDMRFWVDQPTLTVTTDEKAGIYLSEGVKFGETLFRFHVALREESFPGALVLDGAEALEPTESIELELTPEQQMQPFLLSEGDPITGLGIMGGHLGPDAIAALPEDPEWLAVGYHRLSQHPISIGGLGYAEVFDRIHQTEAGDDRIASVESTRATLRTVAATYEDRFLLDAGVLDEQWHLTDTAILSSDRTRTWRYFGFDDVTWGYDGLGWSTAFSWQQLQKQQISFFTSFEKAAIYLDEDFRFGDTNARFAVENYEETEPGAFLLSEAEPANESQLTPLPTDQMEAFLLGEGDPITGFGLLSEHRGPEEIAAAQASVEFQLAGANRLSQHVHRFLPVGFNEVFDRTPYQEEAPLDEQRYEEAELYSNTQEHYFWATDDRRTVEITSRTAERYVDTLDERRSIPEASRTREYQKWATEDPDGIDITSRTAERYWLTLDETRYADAEITSRTAERYRITLEDRQVVSEASRTREYQKWTTEDPDSISDTSRTAERYWLTLDEVRYGEAELYSNSAERYITATEDRQEVAEASRTRTYDKWATEQRQGIDITSRTAERYDTSDIHGALRFWTSPGFGWDQIPWAGAATMRKLDETTEDLVYSTASWSDLSRTADHTLVTVDDSSTIEERAGQVVIARELADSNSTIEEAAGQSVVTLQVADGGGDIADTAGLIASAKAVLDDNSTVEEAATEFVITDDTISEVLFFGWSGTWSSSIKWNPSVEMIDTDHMSHD